jgi:hypothetical protein
MTYQRHKRVWWNCGSCKLCNQTQESAAHLLLHCCFTDRIWTSLKSWFGLEDIQPQELTMLHSVKEWWCDVIPKRDQGMKALASLAMLVLWEIRKCNVHVFRNPDMITKTEEEATLWSLAELKRLVILCRESRLLYGLGFFCQGVVC